MDALSPMTHEQMCVPKFGGRTKKIIPDRTNETLEREKFRIIRSWKICLVNAKNEQSRGLRPPPPPTNEKKTQKSASVIMVQKGVRSFSRNKIK